MQAGIAPLASILSILLFYGIISNGRKIQEKCKAVCAKKS